MDSLQGGLLLCLLPSLAQLIDKCGDPYNCEKAIGKCGARAEVQCSADKDIKAVRVWLNNTGKCEGDMFLNTTCPTNQDARHHLTWSGSTVNLLIDHVKPSDAGSYCYYLKTESDTGCLIKAELQIEGPSEIPQITINRVDMQLVCKASGGCPVGNMQWADGSGTNWTKSAKFEQKDDVFTGTLLLQKSSIMSEYYCTVTYLHLNKTENRTRCISTAKESRCNGQHTERAGDPQDSGTGNNYSGRVFAVVAVVVICAIAALVIYSRRRCAHQDIEMAGDTQSSETNRLHSSTST